MSYDPNAANIAMLKGYVQSARPMEEMFSVRGKTAIVTGATSGLGFNIALRLLQGGANVVIAGSSQKKGDYTLPILAEAGFGADRVVFCRTDVRQEEDMIHLVETADKTFGSVDNPLLVSVRSGAMPISTTYPRRNSAGSLTPISPARSWASST